MEPIQPRRPDHGIRKRLRLLSPALFLLALAGGTGARAAGDDALDILKATSSYMAGQKTISLAFDSSIEIITPMLEKIQFTSSGNVLLDRPDKLRAHRTGGYTDVELVFDGKMASILGKDLNAYAQADLAGSTDQLIDRLRADYGVDAPGADLLLTNMFDELSAGVIEAKHIGRGVVGGVECEHLAFRNADTDWQLWVEIGPKPIPHKYVITSKAVAGAPEYSVTIRDWKTDLQLAADAFAFQPPDGAKKVAPQQLSGIDEVPPGIPTGGAK